MKPLSHKKSGFTLLELLVTLGIFVIMTTILLANQHRFSNTLDLTNLAYDMSLSIRQAQTYGYSVKAQGTSGTANDFQNYFGVHFDINQPNTFLIFADSTSNGTKLRYDPGTDIIVNTYTMKNNFVITALCTVGSNNIEDCHNPNQGNYRVLDIVFKRPNPDANINFYANTSSESTVSNVAHVRIKIKSSDNKYKAIDVYGSGQISVVDATS